MCVFERKTGHLGNGERYEVAYALSDEKSPKFLKTFLLSTAFAH